MTNTAEVIGQAIQAAQAFQGMSGHDIIQFFIAGAAMLCGGVAGQHIIESIIANVPLPWWLPKFMLPSIISSVVGAILKWTGVDTGTATQASVILAGLMHAFNETPLAASLQSRLTTAAAGNPALAAAIQAVVDSHDRLMQNPAQITAQVAHSDSVAALVDSAAK